jgi:uncharacterized BrkB/YihY/UPF0761 family membrane protein
MNANKILLIILVCATIVAAIAAFQADAIHCNLKNTEGNQCGLVYTLLGVEILFGLISIILFLVLIIRISYQLVTRSVESGKVKQDYWKTILTGIITLSIGFIIYYLFIP